MRFCPKCGALMRPSRSEDGKLVWVCPSCGYREDGSQQAAAPALRLKQRIEHSNKERIIVIREEQETKSLPKTRAVCPKCGYEEAYYWVVQTRKADEPPTRFFKCVRCGYVWREYD